MKQSAMSAVQFNKEIVRLLGRPLETKEAKYLDEYLIKTTFSLQEIVEILKRSNKEAFEYTFTGATEVSR